MQFDLRHGDCLEVMRDIADDSLEAIICDPPYFQIKGEFDWEHKTFSDYLEFMELCALEWRRILKKNGSLLVFGHAKRIAYIQVIFDKYFNLENNLVWEVVDRQTNKGINSYRCFAPISERILFYSREVERTGLEEIKANNELFASLREYANKAREHIGYSRKKMIENIGHGGSQHFLEPYGPQWDLPTAETYAQLIEVFSIDKMDGFREYESLRTEYESLRTEYESLRRPFNNVHKLTDVIKHSQESHISKNFAHDTVKPLGLMVKLIETVTNENALVLDCFLGSGTTGVACKLTGRQFIGIEKNPDYFAMASKRIEEVQAVLYGG